MDIEQALKLGFPPESAHKLESRREKCRAALLEEDPTPPSADASPAQNVSAFQSDAISVVSSPEVGRHMIVSAIQGHTVEPLNKGHFGTSLSVLCGEVVLFLEVKNEL